MGFLLFLLSNILGVILIPLGIIWGLFKQLYHRKLGTGLKDANKKFLGLAKAIDKYGNIVCAELFDTLLITSVSTHKFGNPLETISAVVGHNLVAGTLSWEGRLLNRILNFFDPGHSLRAAFGEKL